MKCPACGRELQEMKAGEIVVDVCQNGCGGIWFDAFELQKVDEKHESAGEILLNIERDPSVKVDYNKKRFCPRCKDIKMMKHFVSVKRQVEVDECAGCGGFWLDYGELGQIRNQYETDEERKKAADEYFSELFDEDIAKMRKESEEELASARKIANIFRFLCPSYYIPGKQKWGAF